jgi:tRNA C32,U32 (ribose-2'-O)-methylase TrmJ
MASQTLLRAYTADPESTCAILFGREDDGLPNEALDFCHALVTIPTDSFNASLNLAQAALVVCYELWLTVNPKIEQLHPLTQPEREAAPKGAPPLYGDPPSIFSALEQDLAEDIRLANGTDRETLFIALRDLLRTLHPSSTDIRMAYSMSRLRAVLLRAAPRKDESKMLAHIFQNITQKLSREKNLDRDS